MALNREEKDFLHSVARTIVLDNKTLLEAVVKELGEREKKEHSRAKELLERIEREGEKIKDLETRVEQLSDELKRSRIVRLLGFRKNGNVQRVH